MKKVIDIIRQHGWLRMLPVAVAAIALGACASIGRPDGGPRDETPPVFIQSNPMPGTLNFSGSRITVTFDENITLDNPTQKIVVSPPQKTPPRISSGGRRVNIDLQDTLIPSMTYTIDFADAVKDLNEGNILDGFAMDFSTGATIDTLSISGMVLQASNLEPAQGMIVGVYSAATFTDTTLTSLPLERITKTNQLGQFTVRNLAPGGYRIFALNDLNRDYHWDRSEDIAFYDVELSPIAEPAQWTDTVTSLLGRDSIVVRQGTRFLPDNILLTWFNEEYKPTYLLKNERPERHRLEFLLSAPADSMARFTIAEGPRAGTDLRQLCVIEATAKLDTITCWLTDSLISAADTLRLATTYRFTDSLDNMSWRTDTIPFILRGAKKQKKAKLPADTVAPQMEFVSFALTQKGLQELNQPMQFTSATPIARIDSSAVRFEQLVDTIWTQIPTPRIIRPDTLSHRMFEANVDWKPATKYRLSIDSAGVADIYGLHNRPLSYEFSTRPIEDYSTLYFNLPDLPDSVPALVQLLRNDEPQRTVAVTGRAAVIPYIMPGDYYARLILDTDGNGRWTTGSVAGQLQPEEVYYYPRKISLKKNWDVEQTWNIYETAVDLQKPQAIKKNKPKLKAGEQQPKDADTEEPEDEMWDSMSRDPFFQNPAINRRRQ